VSGARRIRFALAAAVALLALASPAAASVGIGQNLAAPVLRVDAKGNAEISWTERGSQKTILIPVAGPVLPGGRLKGPDVSRPATAPKVAYQRVLRSGPGGWNYALQTWPINAGRPELRFSRWRGAPTTVTLKAESTSLGIALSGVAKFGGKPIPLRSPTPGGTVQRQYVYLHTQVGGVWKILGGVSVKRGGTYRKRLFGGPVGRWFRAGVAGPNVGRTYAPDAIALTRPP
jgi:hypothetical protein